MIHFAVERSAHGFPSRLVWSSEIQRASEEHVRKLQAKREAERIARERPAPWIEEWLKTHPVRR